MVLPVNLASLHWHSLPPSDLAASLTGYLTKSVYPVVLNYEIILFPCCDSLRKFTIKHYQSYSTYLLRTHGDLYMLSLQHGRPENSWEAKLRPSSCLTMLCCLFYSDVAVPCGHGSTLQDLPYLRSRANGFLVWAFLSTPGWRCESETQVKHHLIPIPLIASLFLKSLGTRRGEYTC